MLLYQGKTDLELRKQAVTNKVLLKTYQCVNNGVFGEELMLLEMLVHRKDVRGS